MLKKLLTILIILSFLIAGCFSNIGPQLSDNIAHAFSGEGWVIYTDNKSSGDRLTYYTSYSYGYEDAWLTTESYSTFTHHDWVYHISIVLSDNTYHYLDHAHIAYGTTYVNSALVPDTKPLTGVPTNPQYVTYSGTPYINGGNYYGGGAGGGLVDGYEAVGGVGTVLNPYRLVKSATPQPATPTPAPSPVMSVSSSAPTYSSREWGSTLSARSGTGIGSYQWQKSTSTSGPWSNCGTGSSYVTTVSDIDYYFRVIYYSASGYQSSSITSSATESITKRNVSGLETYKPVPTSTTTTVGDFPKTYVSLFLLIIKPVFNVSS
jgi:hypothetical protein